MASLTDLREGVAANLASITGLQQSGYMLSNPTPPCAEVEPGPIAYDKAMQRGLDRYQLTVRVYVAFSTDIGAQKRLDEFLESTGATSIKAAIESDRTLAGACDALRVTGCTGYRAFTLPGGRIALGAEWTVEIFARGDT